MQQSTITEKTSVQPWWFTLLRIILGLILIWKGIVFLREATNIQQLVEQTGIGVFSTNSEILAFIIPYLSLLCGVFIGSGLFTRVSAAIQIAVLIVAVIFVNSNAVGSTSELILSIVTLLLLVFFVIKGSGQFSADEYFRSYYLAGKETGHTDKAFESPRK